MFIPFQPFQLKIKGKLHDFNTPLVMGIINVTSDSFYAKSRLAKTDDIKRRVEAMINAGADVIDFGAMSSRPGAKISTVKEEISRLSPVVEACKKTFPNIIVSVDTLHGQVADELLNAGADIINDISGGEYCEDMYSVVAKHQCPYICMHLKGTPETMQNEATYNDLIPDILAYFKEKIQKIRKQGITDIILDPGFGFSKDIDQNYSLLKHLSTFRIFDLPILAGISRKSMIYKLLNRSADDALNGTTALHMVALAQGASILRVHDVKEAVEVRQIYQKITSVK